MVRLIDSYGIRAVKKGRNRYYSPELNKKSLIKFCLKAIHKEKLEKQMSF